MAAPTLTVTEGGKGLEIEHLRKSYRRRMVIRDVTMTLHRGEVVALLGPNGSGKTTSFYAIAGLVFPEAGSVRIDGQTVTNLPMYRRARMGIGYLPQEMSIFRGLSVEDNISAVLDVSVDADQEREGLARDLIRAVQTARKEAGLDVSDRIRLGVEGDDDVAAALAAHGDMITAETLAVDLASALGDGFTTDAKLTGKTVKLSVAKA